MSKVQAGVEYGAVWLGCRRAAPRAGERRAQLVERPASRRHVRRVKHSAVYERPAGPQ